MDNMFDNQSDGFAPTPEFVFKLEEGEKVYDDAFVVRKTRYGLYNSIGVDGRKWITALTEEACVYGTRFNLKQKSMVLYGLVITFAALVWLLWGVSSDE